MSASLPTPQPRLRLAVVNAWHDDNVGDSAIVSATVDLLERVLGASVTVVSMIDERDSRWPSARRHLVADHPGLVVLPSPIGPPLFSTDPRRGSLSRWRHQTSSLGAAVLAARGQAPAALAELVADFDAVVLVGGHTLFAKRRRGSSLATPLRLAHLLAPVAAANRAGVPVVALGHTVGPFEVATARWMAARRLRGVSALVCREERSAAALRKLGLDRVQVGPDVVFGLRVESGPSPVPMPPGRVAIATLRANPYLGPVATERLVAQTGAALQRCVHQGVVDSVVCVGHTKGPTAIEDDRPVAHALAARIGPSATVIDDDLSPQALSRLYGTARVLVAGRLHSLILAALHGTPAVAVADWGHKARGVQESLGLGHLVVEYDQVEAQQLGALVEQACSVSRLELSAAVAARSVRLESLVAELLGHVRAGMGVVPT